MGLSTPSTMTWPPRLKIQSAIWRSSANEISARRGSASKPRTRPHRISSSHLRTPLLSIRSCRLSTIYHCSLAPNCVVLRPAARIPRGKNAGAGNRGRVVRVIEHVEEVDVESQIDLLGDGDELERRSILEPLPGQRHVLVPPRIQVVVECYPLHRAVVQRNPDVVGIPEGRHVGSGRSVWRKRRLALRDQRRGRRLVVRRHSHDAVRLSVGVTLLIRLAGM